MRNKKRKSTNKKSNFSIIALVSSILFILYLVVAYMLFHSRTITSYEAEKSVIEKLYVVVERNKESIQDYNETLKEEFIIRASSVSYIIENSEDYENNPEKLNDLAKILMVDEIHLFSPSGVIVGGTRPEYYGYSLYSGEQMSFFIPLLSDQNLSLCQDIVPNTAEGKMMMYAMVWRKDLKGMVEIGVDPKRLAYEMNENEVLNLVETMPVTQGRKLIVADKESSIIIGSTDSSYLGESLYSMGLPPDNRKGLVQTLQNFNGELSFISFYYGENFILAVTQSLNNAYSNVWGPIIILSLFVILIGTALCVVTITYNKKLSIERDERLKENEKKNRELSIALEKAKSASKSKSAFLLSMSHDLRTPMNAIIGYSNLLDKCDLTDEERRYLNNMKVSERQLMNLLNGVLSMTRIESGRIELEKDSWNIYEIFDDVNIIIKEQADEKGVNFSYETQGNDYSLLLDKTKYSEILLNILSNAIKYTNMGGKVVMRNTIRQDNDLVIVKTVIEDSGIGMSPSFLPHIFESFERESMPGIGKEEGYGLGMSITKSLVEIMNGEINVDSTLGVGTTVTVTIPFNKAEKKVKNQNLLDLKWTGVNALLVEDNNLNAEIAQLMLEDLGFVVDRAENGEIAIDMVRKKNPPYSIVFMDILMPVLNGYEATKTIRNLKGICSEVPIIAMTANAFEEDKLKAIASGMDGHVQKPLEKDTLVKAIYDVLGM